MKFRRPLVKLRWDELYRCLVFNTQVLVVPQQPQPILVLYSH